MEGHAAGVDGRNPGWSGDDHALEGFLFQIMEKGRLAGTGFAGEKNMAVGVLDEIVGELQLGISSSHNGSGSEGRVNDNS